MFPTLPRIELFARSTRPGWAAWGNELPISPSPPVAERPAEIADGEDANRQHARGEARDDR